MRLSRDWIARKGPKRHRGTTLVFVLRGPALVEFVVVQVSPECRRVGRFRVRGKAGRNRVVFRGRVGRTVLSPGTYRILAKAGRQRVVDARLVVVSRRDRAEIVSARGADACSSGATAGTAVASSFAGAAGGAGSTGSTGSNGTAAQQGAHSDKAGPTAGSRPERGALGARFAREAVDQVAIIPLWLIVAIAGAAALGVVTIAYAVHANAVH